MEYYKAAILVILAFAIAHVNGWLFHDKCRNHHVNHTSMMSPYWFGRSDLNCLMDKKGGRRKRAPAPRTSRLSYSHSFIYYRGYYIEYFGTLEPDTDIVYVETYPQPEDEDCDPQTNDHIDGYGVLSIDCIRRCGEQFVNEREYSLFNGCHDFANYISDILCHHNECPC